MNKNTEILIFFDEQKNNSLKVIIRLVKNSILDMIKQCM